MSSYDEIYGEDDKAHEGKPHGWIQWKGTRPCIDMHCACGSHGHMDADFFFYYYKCAVCGQKYALGANVRLIPLTVEQVAKIEKDYDWKLGGAFQFDQDLADQAAEESLAAPTNPND